MSETISLESEGIIYYMSLYLASLNGHKDIVEYISELPTKPACECSFELASIFLTVQKGDLEMFKYALDNAFRSKSNHNEIAAELNLDCIDITENLNPCIVDNEVVVNENDNEVVVNENDNETEAPICNTIFEAAEMGGPNELKKFFECKVGAYNKNGYSALHISAHHNRLGNVDFLLEHGATLEHETKHTKKTALHVACENDHLNIVSFLLNRGANIDAMDGDGSFPLICAIKAENPILVQLLLKKGANTEVVDVKTGNGPLYYAVTNENEEIVRLLLENGADIEVIEKKTRNSLLHYAAINRNESIVRLLLGKGASTENKNQEDKFPLYYAVESGKTEIVRLLLDKGANIHSQPYLCHAENEDVIKLLLERGLYNTEINTYGRTILEEAVRLGNTVLVQFLLKEQFDFNVNTIDESGYSPLMIASSINKCDIIDALLQHGANINFTKESDGTSLHLALLNQCYEAAELLLKHNANVNVNAVRSSQYHETPLMLAMRNGMFELVTLILSNGASVDIIDKAGFSPLMIATKCNKCDIMEALLQHGADVNFTKQSDGSSLCLAVSYNFYGAAELLLKYKANVDEVFPNRGETPLALAVTNESLQMIQLLLSNGASKYSRYSNYGTIQTYVNSYCYNVEIRKLFLIQYDKK